MSLDISCLPHRGVVSLNASAVFFELLGWKMLCEVKVFLCLIKHVKKDKVRLGNKAKLEEKKKCGCKGDMSR